MEKAVQLEQLRDVQESLIEMIKQIANEPSVGLYFVQQHVHRVVPTLVSHKLGLVESSQAAVLSTEDAKDALTLVRTMKEVGPSKIEKMKSILNSTVSALQHSQNVKRKTVVSGSSILESTGHGKSLFNLDKQNLVNHESSESYCEDSTSKLPITAHALMEESLFRIESPAFASSFCDAALNRSISNVSRETSNLNYVSNLASTHSSPVGIAASAKYTAPIVAELQNEVSTCQTTPMKAGNIERTSSGARKSYDMSVDTTRASEGGPILNTMVEVLKEFTFLKPARYMRAVFGSAQKSSDYGGNYDQKKLQVYGRKVEDTVEEVGSSMHLKGLILQDSYEESQEEHKAKLEAWLQNLEEPASTKERDLLHDIS